MVSTFFLNEDDIKMTSLHVRSNKLLALVLPKINYLNGFNRNKRQQTKNLNEKNPADSPLK